jgi:acyl-CoA synthetase (AMP-forming)/AMP-acid ligase II
MGLIGGILQPIVTGVETTLFSPLHFIQRPLRWLRAISNYRATASFAPNFAYKLCVKKAASEDLTGLDLSSWNVACNGAEPIHADTLEMFSQTFKPYGFRHIAHMPSYGLAEATLICTGKRFGDAPSLLYLDKTSLAHDRVELLDTGAKNAVAMVGCGKPHQTQQVFIVNPQDRSLLGQKQIGEIWLSGPSVALGYWDKPELSERIFRARKRTESTPLDSQPNGPTSLRTGDLGFVHQGELFVVGRLKDLMIIEGKNVHPQDIEKSAEQAHPAIRPGCVVAFSIDTEEGEQLVVVAETKVTDNMNDQIRELDQIRRQINQTLSKEHELRAYRIVLIKPKSMPKTSSGKLMRSHSRHLFIEEKLETW